MTAPFRSPKRAGASGAKPSGLAYRGRATSGYVSLSTSRGAYVESRARARSSSTWPSAYVRPRRSSTTSPGSHSRGAVRDRDQVTRCYLAFEAAWIKRRAVSNCSSDNRMCECRQQALREDPGLLDGGSPVEVGNGDDRPDRKAPRPPFPLRVVLGRAGDLDDPEDRLPDGRVEHGQLARLDRRALRRGVGADLVGVDARRQRPVAAAADQEPVRQTRSTTAAIAWPKPMHMLATP